MSSIKLLVLSVIFLLATSTNVKTQEGFGVEDLKDLLSTSIKHTTSLNGLVTQLTQKIVNTMLSLGEMTNKVDEMDKAWNQEIEGIKASFAEEIFAVKQSMQLEFQKLKNSSEADLQSLEAKLDALREDSEAGHQSQETQLKKMSDEIDAIKTTIFDVKIINGEEDAGNPKCSKVCAGTTGRHSTATAHHSSQSFYIDVDISDCGFVKIPTVTTSLEGTGGHYHASGTASPYSVTPAGFRVYIKNASYESEGVQKAAKRHQWNVEWVAVGYTC